MEFTSCLTYHFNLYFLLQGGNFSISSEPHLSNVEKFLAAVDEMALPRFEQSDLEEVLLVFLRK